MKVYVVECGEKNEASYIRGIYLNMTAARKEVDTIEPCFDSGWIQESDTYWSNECDFKCIRIFEVID